jgi:hypothetical protein
VDSKEHRVRTTSSSSAVSLGTSPNESVSSSVGSAPQSLPSYQHPSHALLKENGFTQQVYTRYRARCLKGKVVESNKFCGPRLFKPKISEEVVVDLFSSLKHHFCLYYYGRAEAYRSRTVA